MDICPMTRRVLQTLVVSLGFCLFATASAQPDQKSSDSDKHDAASSGIPSVLEGYRMVDLSPRMVARIKRLNGDIEEGKRTLMLIQLFERASEAEKEELIRIFNLERSERVQYVGEIRDLMQKYQCIEHARRVSCAMAGASLFEFELIYGKLNPSRDKDFIHDLIQWMIERT